MSTLVDQLQAFATNVADGPEWARQLRERGAQAFSVSGLPTSRVEAWKYTPLNRRPIGPVGDSPAVTAGSLPASSKAIAGAVRVVVVDGALAGIEGVLPNGLELVSLEQAIEADDGALAQWLAEPSADGAADALVALNNATLGAGLVLRVASGVDAGRVALEWRGVGGADARLRNSRLCIDLGEGASLSLVESDGGEASAQLDLNIVMQARLAAGARLNHARLQTTQEGTMQVARTHVEQAGQSSYQYDGLDIGAGLARHELIVRLAGEGAKCALNGAYLPRGEAHVDYHLAVEHAAPGCTSEQFFRGVVDDRARAVFSGKVHVAPGADGTEAHQSNANLLLSADAEVDTKPELVIEADEVVASHGATVGQLDDTALFYLRSRGLDEALAREVLIGAFCRAAVDRAGDTAARDLLATELSRYTGVEE
ncbi:Fe-S cluster assembly protein SufD [Marinihelvus fidelis]|uniref:Fe-S cluster assembly protein SufD n=1 Tax=Marinihelvus fidelis TaxID=2613842 RepID=A0A5N0THR0_9GAMM|nr:Fe-S cluster assembly protein SufD [Marinihelvus fidelis]KAA9133396.1 Fe-S cluster assembly protein SufD [Marinihelvus fidelis]